MYASTTGQGDQQACGGAFPASAADQQACYKYHHEQQYAGDDCSRGSSLASSYDSGRVAFAGLAEPQLQQDPCWHAEPENALQRACSVTSCELTSGQGQPGRALECSERLAGKTAGPSAPASGRPGLPVHARSTPACASTDLGRQIRNEQQREAELAPLPNYLEQHASDANADGFITPQMRMIVTSWMCEVAAEFRLQQETLFLAVALLDRFLSVSKAVPRTVLQLVAVSCIFLASKQEEVAHPSVEELTDIAANCFTKEDLLRMEMILLDSFNWRIKTPTAYSQLHLLCQGLQARLSPTVTATAAYLTELSLLDYGSLSFPPSAVAGAAVLLAQATHGSSPTWEPVCDLLGYEPHNLAACLGALLHLQHCALTAAAHEAHQPVLFVRNKFSSPAWLSVGSNTQLLQATPAVPAGACGSDGDVQMSA